MRSLVLPSHSGGMPPRFQRPSNSLSSAGASATGSVPISSLVPIVTVSGRSVVLRMRDAGHAHHRGFLGHAAGIGDHRLGVLHQVVELQIRLRIDQQQVRRQRAQRAQRLGRARMHRKDDRQAAHRRRRWPAARRGTACSRVDVGRPVQRHHDVLAGRQSELAPERRRPEARPGSPAACRSSCCRRRRCARRRRPHGAGSALATSLVVKK